MNDKINQIRAGNRGGRDLFKWEDVRLMPYKERECYLGATVKLGYLDKGGKWRKRDWWTAANSNEDPEGLKNEIAAIKREEEDLIRQRLGLAPLKSKTPTEDKPVINNLSTFEMKELTKKNTEEQTDFADERDKAERVAGIGYAGRNFHTNADTNTNEDLTALNKLEGYGLEEGDNVKEKVTLMNGKDERSKDIKKRHKKEKHKKNKHKKHKKEKKSKK